MKTKFARQNLA